MPSYILVILRDNSAQNCGQTLREGKLMQWEWHAVRLSGIERCYYTNAIIACEIKKVVIQDGLAFRGSVQGQHLQVSH